MQRSLEPVGTAARDVRECLLLQIDARARQNGTPDLTVERAIVNDYLKDVEANRLPRIARALGIEIDRVKSAILSLRQFHIHPGRLLISDHPRAIRPDAIIEFDEEEDCYTARLTNGRLPAVHISPRYLKLIKDQSLARKDREFLSNNIRSARWLLEAIEQRNNTLLRVISVVIGAQRDFFDQGPQMLKPLPMTVVADQLGIHVATVSRAVHEKYLQTPRGIFPLRMFFSGGTETESGDAMSWAAVQAKLEQIIKEEDKADPLSDDQLVDKLKEAGIELARRTVAKYRKQMNIPPARQRKEF
jgi:RNA polymerase sigma-54 factor